MDRNSSKNKGSGKKSSKKGLTMRLTLIMFALVPLIVSSVTIGFISISKSKKELKNYTHDSIVQVIDSTGTSFDTVVSKNAEALKGYATAPK